MMRRKKPDSLKKLSGFYTLGFVVLKFRLTEHPARIRWACDTL